MDVLAKKISKILQCNLDLKSIKTKRESLREYKQSTRANIFVCNHVYYLQQLLFNSLMFLPYYE